MPRDKFAAMASRASGESTGASDSASAASGAATDTSTPSQPPRRDKLAALAARNNDPPSNSDGVASVSAGRTPSGVGRGNKLAAMAANPGTSAAANPAVVDEKKLAKETKRKHLEKIKERLTKREKILQNLDRAEDLTCKLLEIAHQTTTALQDLNCAPNISELSLAYRQTLRELHPLLSTDTESLIQPYKNHANETKQSMYAARVEMRLAKERTQVLKVFTDLEAANHPSGDLENSDLLTKKRPREDEA